MMRVVVHERRLVAELLAGRDLDGVPGELVDVQLRAVARAVLALRAHRMPEGDELLVELVELQGAHVGARECEELRREGALRRAA